MLSEPQCAARPDWLETCDGLGSIPGRGVGFSVGWTNSGHAVRLISRTGTEGLPVPSLNCELEQAQLNAIPMQASLQPGPAWVTTENYEYGSLGLHLPV